jgi:hypothetical protein
LELNKKNELIITKQANFFVEKICDKMNKEENTKNKKHNHSGSIELGQNRVQKFTDTVKKYKEHEEEDDYSQEIINLHKKKGPTHKSKKIKTF